MKNVLTRDEFNAIVEASEGRFETQHSEALGNCEEVHPKIVSFLIDAVLSEGYSLMALCVMLMGYQLDIGHKLEEMQKMEFIRTVFGQLGYNMVVVDMPTENPFQP